MLQKKHSIVVQSLSKRIEFEKNEKKNFTE